MIVPDSGAKRYGYGAISCASQGAWGALGGRFPVVLGQAQWSAAFLLG